MLAPQLTPLTPHHQIFDCLLLYRIQQNYLKLYKTHTCKSSESSPNNFVISCICAVAAIYCKKANCLKQGWQKYFEHSSRASNNFTWSYNSWSDSHASTSFSPPHWEHCSLPAAVSERVEQSGAVLTYWSCISLLQSHIRKWTRSRTLCWSQSLLSTGHCECVSPSCDTSVRDVNERLS